MKTEVLEKLYQEKRLIKELIRIDSIRYGYLEDRIREIKIKINTEYIPLANPISFIPYDATMSARITSIGSEKIRELLTLLEK
jgi:hypothetical protein